MEDWPGVHWSRQGIGSLEDRDFETLDHWNSWELCRIVGELGQWSTILIDYQSNGNIRSLQKLNFETSESWNI